MLAILIVIDICYMFATTIVLPTLILLTMMTRQRVNLIQPFEDCMDHILQKVLTMSYMDVKGFRSQRTLLQLQLESLPQIVFQAYMLWRMYAMHLVEDIEHLGIDPLAIWISLLFAAIHVILEYMNLYFESKTWKISVGDFMIACYNAKQGWVPHQTQLMQYKALNRSDEKSLPISYDE